MKKGKFRVLSILLAAILLLSGCGTADNNSNTRDPSDPAQNPTSAGTTASRPFTTYLQAPLTSMDPILDSDAATNFVYNLCYEGLYRTTPDGSTVELGQASDVAISEDGLTWTFTIRDDAKWSNGDPVTATDFEFAWKRLANPDTGSANAYLMVIAQIKNAMNVIYGDGDMDTLGVKALDEHTLEVQLEQPCNYLPTVLRHSVFGPINQSFFEEQGDQYALSLDNSVVNGQYLLTDWVVGGTFLRFEKNQDYYGKDDVLNDVVESKYISDPAQLVMAWENNELDIITLTGDYVEMYKDDPAYTGELVGMLYYLTFNVDVPGLDNVNVRKAISLTVDKQSITDYILKDGSVPMNALVPYNFAANDDGLSFREAYPENFPSYDRELAQEYWQKAKEELGVDTMAFDFLYSENVSMERIAAELKSELEGTLDGLTLNLVVEPSNQKHQDESNGNFEIEIGGWGADYVDPSGYTDIFYSGSDYNFGNWSSERYDELYTLAVSEYALDNEKRWETFAELEKILLEDAGICPLYQLATSYLVNPNYTFVFDPTNSIVLPGYIAAK